MKRLSSLFLLTCVISIAFGQQIQIEIDTSIFKHIDRSLILITDQDGMIRYENVLLGSEIIGDAYLTFQKDLEEKQYDLTIYNEYVSQKFSPPKRYYRACTYLNIDSTLIIDNHADFIPPPMCEPNKRKVEIIIKNARKVKEVNWSGDQCSHESAKGRWKDALHLSRHYSGGHDIFLTLTNTSTGKLKYIYIPEEKIEDRMTFDWVDLKDDLVAKTVPLPNIENRHILLSATNEDTQKKCFLFHERIEDHIEELEILIPENIFLYDFELALQHSERSKYTSSNSYYQLFMSDSIPEIQPFPYEKFDVNFDKINSTGFDLTAQNNDLKFKITYREVHFESKEAYEILLHSIESKWTISGDLKKKVKFEFPEIPDYYLANFPTADTKATKLPLHTIISKTVNGRILESRSKRSFAR